MTARRRMRCSGGVQEVVSNQDMWRALLAEFVGVFFLVLIAGGACIGWHDEISAPSRVQISLAFGLAVATLVQCTCHVSGGHLNPALTSALFAVGQVSFLRALFYILTQCVGGIVGASVLHALMPSALQTDAGVTHLHRLVSPVQGFGVEFLTTFLFVLTVFAVRDDNRSDLKGSGPLAIGLAVTTCHLFAIPFTGSSMNPARSFGPAMISNKWEDHWIFWVGPCFGGIAAAMLYQFVFQIKSSAVLIKDDDLILSTHRSSQTNEFAYKTTAI